MYNLVAMYDSRATAERLQARLIAEGIPPSDIRLSSAPAMPSAGALAGEHWESGSGPFAWLFTNDMPQQDRDWYSANLRGDRTVVSVRVANEDLRPRAVETMEEFGPIERDGGWMAESAATATVAGQTTWQTSEQTGGGALFSAADQPAAPVGTERIEQGEQVIPVVKEELAVGKQATERRYRVRSYIVERPVEERVVLRDERVEIERRPVSGPAAAGTTLPQEREVEIIERHEEPVVEKRGRTVEEVVVRKEVTERPETVRGTVRETEVEVEQEPAVTPAGTASSSGTDPAPAVPPRR
jgi:stress response protein YsnF